MKPPMHLTCYKVSYTRDEYGDYVTTTNTALKCHFRYITEQVTSENGETINSDALLWVEPDSGVDREDIIKFDNEYWRVERVVKARKLRNPNVQFIKCELLRYGTIS